MPARLLRARLMVSERLKSTKHGGQMKHPKLRFVCLLTIAFCSIAGLGASSQRPKLVVLIAVDQFRYDYLTRFEKYFGQRGFNLFLKEGANFVNTHYSHSQTSTGPGHAVWAATYSVQ